MEARRESIDAIKRMAKQWNRLREIPGKTKAQYEQMHALEDSVRLVIKTLIDWWAEDHGVECSNRVVIDLRGPWLDSWRECDKKLRVLISMASIYNGKGQIPGREKWLNKISVSPDRIMSHVARTDPAFLGDVAQQFQEFVAELQEELKDVTT